jgi:hypothetical protein
MAEERVLETERTLAESMGSLSLQDVCGLGRIGSIVQLGPDDPKEFVPKTNNKLSIFINMHGNTTDKPLPKVLIPKRHVFVAQPPGYYSVFFTDIVSQYKFIYQLKHPFSSSTTVLDRFYRYLSTKKIKDVQQYVKTLSESGSMAGIMHQSRADLGTTVRPSSYEKLKPDDYLRTLVYDAKFQYETTNTQQYIHGIFCLSSESLPVTSPRADKEADFESLEGSRLDFDVDVYSPWLYRYGIEYPGEDEPFWDELYKSYMDFYSYVEPFTELCFLDEPREQLPTLQKADCMSLFKEIQSVNLLNVRVLEQLAARLGFPGVTLEQIPGIEDFVIKSIPKTSIFHYDNIHMSHLLQFFKKVQCDDLTIITDACRGWEKDCGLAGKTLANLAEKRQTDLGGKKSRKIRRSRKIRSRKIRSRK